jgi:hypothetical protein
MTVREFLELLEARSGVPRNCIEILYGFPPKPIPVNWFWNTHTLALNRVLQLFLKGDAFSDPLISHVLQLPSNLDTSKLAELGLANGDTLTLKPATFARIEESVLQSFTHSNQAPTQVLPASFDEV